jgi:hypothetical protein
MTTLMPCGRPPSRFQQLVQVGALGRHLVFGTDLGVHRQQVVPSLDLHAMPGIKNYTHACAAGGDRELAKGLDHLAQRRVLAQRDLEAEAAQHASHGLRIVDRILQGADAVGRIADHQRDGTVVARHWKRTGRRSPALPSRDRKRRRAARRRRSGGGRRASRREGQGRGGSPSTTVTASTMPLALNLSVTPASCAAGTRT